jgi:hypothetical protein
MYILYAVYIKLFNNIDQNMLLKSLYSAILLNLLNICVCVAPTISQRIKTKQIYISESF